MILYGILRNEKKVDVMKSRKKLCQHIYEALYKGTEEQGIKKVSMVCAVVTNVSFCSVETSNSSKMCTLRLRMSKWKNYLCPYHEKPVELCSARIFIVTNLSRKKEWENVLSRLRATEDPIMCLILVTRGLFSDKISEQNHWNRGYHSLVFPVLTKV